MSEYISGVSRRSSSSREINQPQPEKTVFSPQNCAVAQQKNVTMARCHAGRKQPESTTPELRIFKPGEDATDIYRFRYKIYEKEMQRNDHYADHENAIIKDPLDEYAYNIAAYKDGGVVAVNRVNFCKDGDPGEYLTFYELDSVQEDFPDRVSFSTRLMADASARGGVIPLLVSVEGFKLGIERNVNWCYCDCNAHLVSFFEKLGFESFRPSKIHPSFGEVTVLRFDLRSGKHFDRKQSVLARYLKK